MIAKTYISQNLNKIERLFNEAKNPQSSRFYSKLAILELGGWIEMSMDDLIKRLAKRKLRQPATIKRVEEIIESNFGFGYKKNFKNKMLLQIVGLVGVEKFDRKVNGIKIQKLMSSLDALKKHRDQEAHEYTKALAKPIDAPSVTKGRLVIIYEGLIEIERVLKKL